jgi:hypothetical protein
VRHLDEDGLILLFYGEAPLADREHVAACAACGAAYEALSRDLQLVVADDAPPRDVSFETAVWARLAPHLERTRPRAPWGARPWTWTALAASIVLAFVLGRATAPPRAVPSPVTDAADPGTRERILLVAVGEHLERSLIFLVELANAEPGRAGVESESAKSLLTDTRLVRQSADLAGDTGTADVLDELERVLAEVAHASAAGGEADHAAGRQRLEKRGLLFKVRVLAARSREKERPAGAARPGQAL